MDTRTISSRDQDHPVNQVTASSQLQEVERQYREFINPSLGRLLKFSGYGVIEDRAEGCLVYDQNNQAYLDCAGGYGVFSLGHRHPAVIEAVKAQLDRMPLSAKVFFNQPCAQLSETLARITPGALQHSFFCNSGAEAIEAALKFARLATGRSEFVSALNAFHGKTLGALSISGRELYRKPFEPLLPDCRLVPYGDTRALEETVSEHTAAVILEPIQGEGGIIIPPADYLREAQEICRRQGALFILDEVQTGLGRTGRMFAAEHWGLEPDILCLAKALGGGVMPIGAVIGTREVWQAIRNSPLLHTSTFGGNSLACVAALAAIRILEGERLPERAQVMGRRLQDALAATGADFPQVVAEVRGMGLMIGVELTREGYGGAVIMEMARQRVIGVYTLNNPKVIRFEPPLIISTEQVDHAATAFRAAVERAQRMFAKPPEH